MGQVAFGRRIAGVATKLVLSRFGRGQKFVERGDRLAAILPEAFLDLSLRLHQRAASNGDRTEDGTCFSDVRIGAAAGQGAGGEEGNREQCKPRVRV